MKKLVQKLRKNDPQAISYLLEKYVPPLENFAMKIVKDRVKSEEIVAETFDKFRENLPQLKFKKEKNIQSYLYTTTKNASLDHKRKSRPTISALNESMINSSDADDEPTPDESELAKAEQEYAEIMQALYDSVSALPEKQQQAFRLRHFEQKHIQEIAAIMRVSESSVNNNLVHARKKIKKAMKPYLLKYKQIEQFLSYFLDKNID